MKGASFMFQVPSMNKAREHEIVVITTSEEGNRVILMAHEDSINHNILTLNILLGLTSTLGTYIGISITYQCGTVYY